MCGLWPSFLEEVGRGNLNVLQLHAYLWFLALLYLIIWGWNNLILKQNIWTTIIGRAFADDVASKVCMKLRPRPYTPAVTFKLCSSFKFLSLCLKP